LLVLEGAAVVIGLEFTHPQPLSAMSFYVTDS
jgi:hypothetical protein